jgi:hypothetical protein
MRMAVRLLFMVAVVGLVAGPAQAHTIAVRDGGGSTPLCGDSGLLGDWTSLEDEGELEDGDPAGTESILNNCGLNIFSLDLQFSDEADGDPLTHLSPNGPVADANTIFDTLQGLGDGTWRFFSSQGNSIAFEEIVPFGPEAIALSLVIGPNFLFVVDPDSGDPFGFFRITGFGTEQLAAVPEPATLLLLGTGLGGVAAAVKRRRRR